MVPSTAHEPSASLESPIEQNLPLPPEQPLPLGPPVPQAASFEPATSFEPEGSLSDESLGHLGSILGRLTCDGPFMPIPVTAQQGPTMVQQLDEILSSAHQIPVGIDPHVIKFSLNPGPWNIKEHVPVFIMANGAVGSLYALNAMVVSQVPSNIPVNHPFGVRSGMGVLMFDWLQISWIGSPLMSEYVFSFFCFLCSAPTCVLIWLLVVGLLD